MTRDMLQQPQRELPQSNFATRNFWDRVRWKRQTHYNTWVTRRRDYEWIKTHEMIPQKSYLSIAVSCRWRHLGCLPPPEAGVNSCASVSLVPGPAKVVTAVSEREVSSHCLQGRENPGAAASTIAAVSSSPAAASRREPGSLCSATPITVVVTHTSTAGHCVLGVEGACRSTRPSKYRHSPR
jgi:hypothetical protein